MTARASSERQSAASAAHAFRDSFEMSLGGPMFAATDDAQLERIAGWFERDLAALLDRIHEQGYAEGWEACERDVQHRNYGGPDRSQTEGA